MPGDSQASLSMLVAQALLCKYIVDLDNSMARELPATKEEVVAAEVVMVFAMVVACCSLIFRLRFLFFS